MSSTNFLNAKRRVIYQGERGGYFVNINGKKAYGIKAQFRSNGTKISHANVPSPIRRKIRKDAGKARKYVQPTLKRLQKFFASSKEANDYVKQARKTSRKMAPNSKHFPIRAYNRAGVVVVGRNGDRWRVQRVYPTLEAGPKYSSIWVPKRMMNGY